jgi:hypothetical protein
MNPVIDHHLLDLYERSAGDPQRLPASQPVDADLWEMIEALMLDLHLIRHGYATSGHARHTENRLKELCTDASVVERMKTMRV